MLLSLASFLKETHSSRSRTLEMKCKQFMWLKARPPQNPSERGVWFTFPPRNGLCHAARSVLEIYFSKHKETEALED